MKEANVADRMKLYIFLDQDAHKNNFDIFLCFWII